MMRFCCLFAALFLLAGCESAADRAIRNSPDFKAGYSEGCDSAQGPGANPRDSGLVRDNAAFAGNQAYRAGWNTGFNACRRAPLGQDGSRGPIADPSPNPRPF